MKISNAILWTHFVTPREDQAQQDQTMWVSYHKKEESEELEDDLKSFRSSRTAYFDVGNGVNKGGMCEG